MGERKEVRPPLGSVEATPMKTEEPGTQSPTGDRIVTQPERADVLALDLTIMWGGDVWRVDVVPDLTSPTVAAVVRDPDGDGERQRFRDAPEPVRAAVAGHLGCGYRATDLEADR